MLKKLIALMFVCSVAHSATWYISPSGNDTSGNGTTGTPWATLSKAFDEMSGGDTLIVKDGTYTGATNSISGGLNALPPHGTSGAWTIIKAEHDGMAIFDGQNARDMFYSTDSGNLYWQFEGLVWCNTPDDNVGLYYGSYAKFLRCGAYNCGAGNVVNFGIGQDAHYVLLENCYAYGTNGRVKFGAYQSDHIVFRKCVGRIDRLNAVNEPVSGFSIYSTTDCEVQNCIIIDCDTPAVVSNVLEYSGAYYMPCTSENGNRINVVNSVALNYKLGGGITAGRNDYYSSDNVTATNCTFWDTAVGTGTDLYMLQGLNLTLNRCTMGNGEIGNNNIFSSYDDRGDNATTIKNSIIRYMHGGDENSTLFYDVETEDFNCLYGNTVANGYAGQGGSTYQSEIGAHSITNVDPIWNASTNTSGALKYIVRTESGNSLATLGEGGTQIGANALKMVGAPGTIWGETGYNVEQTTDMWPFPIEDLIKTKMAAYTATGIDGARGFAATGTQLNGVDDITLTSYIWEYLGNEMPADIYGEDTSSPTISGISATVHATSATITWTTNESANSRVDYGTTTGYGSNVTGAAYSTSHSLNITGLSPETVYHYKITTADSTGNSTESADQNFTTDAEEEEPEEPASVGITIQGVTITGGISIIAD